MPRGRRTNAAFRRNLIDLARACNRHHIGLMITVGDTASFIDEDGTINRDHIRELVSALVTRDRQRTGPGLLGCLQ